VVGKSSKIELGQRGKEEKETWEKTGENVCLYIRILERTTNPGKEGGIGFNLSWAWNRVSTLIIRMKRNERVKFFRGRLGLKAGIMFGTGGGKFRTGRKEFHGITTRVGLHSGKQW